MPAKCYNVYENETLSFTENSVTNKTIKVLFYSCAPLLINMALKENLTLGKHKYCGPLMQLIQELAVKEKAK